MSQNRRDFLMKSGLFASAIALGPLFSLANKGINGEDDSADFFDLSGKKIKSFGLQLYTLRDDLPKDPKGILKQVADFGYKQLEGYEGELGLWWGMKHPEFKKYLNGLGLKMISSHCDTAKDLDRKAAEAAEVGLKYLISPWVGPQKSVDDYKKIADGFNKAGEICKKNGIRFAYHNHDYSFVKLDGGQYATDIFMEGTDASLVDFEMDMYWVVTAGQDPEAWLKKYPNRFRLCHVKDRSKTAKADEHDASVDLGTGNIDYAKIIKTASQTGMQYYIVEQEKYEGTTPLNSAAADANWFKKLRY